MIPIYIYSKDSFYYDIIKVGEAQLIDILSLKNELYETFEIPKKGGVRTVYAIDKDSYLYKIQKELEHNFLSKIDLPKCAKGFVKGCSYRDFLESHQGNRYFIRIDLKSFFDTIKKSQFEDVLNGFVIIKDKEVKQRVIDIIIDICSLDNKFPQGVVTSPCISNIIFRRIDQRILKYCQVFDVEYTRYADDMLFSSKNLNFGEKKWFLKKIRYILYQNGFMLNYSKEKIAETEISLNGFVVSNSIRLSRKRFLDIKHIVLLCKKQLGTQPLEDKVTFLKNVNNTKLVYRDLSKYPFLSIDQIVQYLSGYRSFFISWIDEFDKNTANQKQIMKSIRIIEKIVDKLDKKYIS